MHLDKLWESLANYNSPQLIVVLVIVAIIAVAALLRHFFAGGTARLAAEQNTRSEALALMERQIERGDTHREKQDERIRVLEETRVEDARYEQNYRHALANKTQAYMAWGSVMHELLTLIRNKWVEMPSDWKTDIDGLSTAEQIDARHPMPKRNG